MRKSTNSARSSKPRKPHPDFPLTAHPSGLWCKKVKGRLHYFCPWADPQAALEKWLRDKDDLLAGRVPRARKGASSPVLSDECNSFMNTKRVMMESGELSVHSWRTYFRIAESLVKAFGRDRLLTDNAQG